MDQRPSSPSRILCIDDDAAVLDALRRLLARLGHETFGAGSVLEGLEVLRAGSIDLVITDWSMPGLSGMDLLNFLRDDGNDTPVVVLTGFGSIAHAVTAIQAGAVNYLVKPFASEQLHLAVTQALEIARLRSENARLQQEEAARRSEDEIVGETAVMRTLHAFITSAGSSRATVLLQGESGTGKELVARAIHAQSERRRGPFVRLNCAALPEGLIESTLFGHEKGAFTGAFKRTIGAFERADGGTLLLDEISEMRLDLQPKLLRVLQEREFERIGGTHPISADVRIIATTNRDLRAFAESGLFRQDLFFRLSVFPIVVPPLRERSDDIPRLAYRFATRAAAENGRPFHGIAPAALELLRSHDWPGNVRELQHAVERAVILAGGPTLEARHFSFTTRPARQPSATRGAEGDGITVSTLDLATAEQELIDRALQRAGGNRTRAAHLLGIDIRTLRRKLNDQDGRGVAPRSAGAGPDGSDSG